MKLTPRTWADIKDKLPGMGDNLIDGSMLINGTVSDSKLNPVSVNKWNHAYDLRVETWALPLSYAANAVSLVVQGADTDVDVVGVPGTVTLCVRNGVITNYAGRFSAMDPASHVTMDLHAIDGLVVPSASFIGVDTDTGASRLVTVIAGRIISV